MRRWLPVLLALLLLLTPAAPALAADYRATAIDYLRTKYEVADDQIHLYEGSILELELTGESFWCAKYSIGPDEERVNPGVPEPAPDEVRPEGAVEPGKELPGGAGREPQLLPLPPDGSSATPGADTWGALYIRVSTGKVLEGEAAESYFTAERQLAAGRWERLRLEAGKLDVSLYLKVKELVPSERVAVCLYPTPVISEAISTRFDAIRQNYPEFTEGIELTDLLSVRIGLVGPDGVATDLPLPRAAEPEGVEPAYRPEDGERWEEYRREYSAFSEQIEQLRADAAAASLSAIESALEETAVAFREEGSALVADLTAGEIRALAELPSVAMISQYAVYDILDVPPDQTAPCIDGPAAGGAGDSHRLAENADPGADGGNRMTPLLCTGAALLIGLGAVLILKRRTEG